MMLHHLDCFIEFNPLMRQCRVCDALRACEERVRQDQCSVCCVASDERLAKSENLLVSAWEKFSRDQFEAGYAAAIFDAGYAIINDIKKEQK